LGRLYDSSKVLVTSFEIQWSFAYFWSLFCWVLNNKLSPHSPFTDICDCKCPLAWISWTCDNQHANLEVHLTLQTSFPASSWLDWKIAQHAVTSSIQAQPTKRHLREWYLRPNHHADEFALEDGYLWFLLSLIIPMPPRPPDWAGYNFSHRMLFRLMLLQVMGEWRYVATHVVVNYELLWCCCTVSSSNLQSMEASLSPPWQKRESTARALRVASQVVVVVFQTAQNQITTQLPLVPATNSCETRAAKLLKPTVLHLLHLPPIGWRKRKPIN
jgi:hypothetical protein